MGYQMPCIQLSYSCSSWNCCIQNLDDMSKCVLPYTKLKFMHEINNKHRIGIKAKGSQLLCEGILGIESATGQVEKV